MLIANTKELYANKLYSILTNTKLQKNVSNSINLIFFHDTYRLCIKNGENFLLKYIAIDFSPFLGW